FAPDGKQLASGAWDGTARLWDLAKRQEQAVLKGHATMVVSLAFTADGKRLATAGGDDGTVKLWDLARGEELASLQGHPDRLYAVAFTPDDQVLVSGGGDPQKRSGEVRLWRAPRH